VVARFLEVGGGSKYIKRGGCFGREIKRRREKFVEV